MELVALGTGAGATALLPLLHIRPNDLVAAAGHNQSRLSRVRRALRCRLSVWGGSGPRTLCMTGAR